MKEGKYTGKNGKLMEPGDETKHEMMKKDVELDGIEGVESGKQPGNKIRRKYRKFGLQNMQKNMKEEKYIDKIKNPIEPGGENKNKEMKNKVEYDGKEDAVTRVAQSKKYKNLLPNTNATNDSRYNVRLVGRILEMCQ